MIEPKKSGKADLEKKKLLFFQIGLIIALALSLVAMEWSSEPKRSTFYSAMREVTIEEEQIPITEEMPPEQALPPELTVRDLFEIVDDDVLIDHEIEFEDDEPSSDQVVEIYAPILRQAEDVMDDEVFQLVEEMPRFRGGDINNFRDWVQRRIRYPAEAVRNHVQGKVQISFIVEPDGRVSTVNVTGSIDPLIDEAAKEVVMASPRWEPGLQRGRPVRVRYSISLIFQL